MNNRPGGAAPIQPRGWLREIGWVIGVVPPSPVADVARRQLLLSELVLGLATVLLLAYWYVLLPVGAIVGIVRRVGPSRGVTYAVEVMTAALMRLFRRPFPTPDAAEPLATRFPYERGWHLGEGLSTGTTVATDEWRRLRPWHLGAGGVVAGPILMVTGEMPLVVFGVALTVGGWAVLGVAAYRGVRR